MTNRKLRSVNGSILKKLCFFCQEGLSPIFVILLFLISSYILLKTPFQKTFAQQTSLRTCEEIARGYDSWMCSTMTTTGYGCGPVSDPERNNICYSQIQIAQSSDCLFQGKVCRYYNKQTCGNTNQECQTRCGIEGCRYLLTPSVVPTLILVPTLIPTSVPTPSLAPPISKFDFRTTSCIPSNEDVAGCTFDGNGSGVCAGVYKELDEPPKCDNGFDRIKQLTCLCNYTNKAYLCPDGRVRFNNNVWTGSRIDSPYVFCGNIQNETSTVTRTVATDIIACQNWCKSFKKIGTGNISRTPVPSPLPASKGSFGWLNSYFSKIINRGR